MSEEKKPLVIVLSRIYSTGLSVIRSLGAAGYTVDLVASAYKKGDSAIAASSKYVRNSVEVVSKKVKDSKDEGLLNELLKYADSGEENIVLFPTDDYTTSVMDANRSVLSKYFIMPSIVGGGDGSITERMNKTFQGALAKSVGLLTPLEWIFNLNDPVVIPEDMVYPCFCKPIESITGYKREMAICKNKKELQAHLTKLQKKFADRSILVQEYLNIDYEIDMSGVCLDQEIIIPAIIKKTDVAKYERGVTLAGKLVPFDEISEIKEKIINMLKGFHYFGMFDMEFNVVGDKIYFNEVNLRSGGPNYSYFASGVNLPALFVKEALGERHTQEEECVAAYNKSFIYEKVAWEDYIHGFLTKKELDQKINAADIKLLYNDEDPEPAKLFLKRIRLTALNTKYKKLKGNCKDRKNRIAKKIKSFLSKVKQTILRYPQVKKENARNPESEKPRVIIAGRNYCSNLCMARSLGEAGYEVEVLRIFTKRPKWNDIMKHIKPDAYSKYVKAYRVCVTNRKDERIIKRLVQIRDRKRKMLLIPNDDLVASAIDAHYKELRRYYHIPNRKNRTGRVNYLMRKGVQKRLAREAGLPIVNSCVIRTRNGKFRIPESVTYPCFVKPNVSRNSSKSRMRRCDSRKELRATLKEFSAKKDIEMIVEDYLDIKRECSILGVSTKEGVLGPGFFFAKDGGHKERRGVAMTGELVPYEDYKELLDSMNQFVGSLEFEGLYDIDLVETTDGKIYFVELNLRFGASGYAVTQSGVNLPGMFADYKFFGTPIDLNATLTENGKSFVSEKIMIDEYLNNYITKAELNQKMAEADVHFIKNDADPRPYKHFKKFLFIASVIKKTNDLKAKIAAGKVQAVKTAKETARKLKNLLLGYPQARKENARNPESEKPRVIIAGRNYSSNLCMARALGEAGYEVEVLRIFTKRPKWNDIMKHIRPDAYSKYVKSYRVCVTNRKDERIIKRLVQIRDRDRKMLLIPNDDLVASAIDAHYKELRRYYHIPNRKNRTGRINYLMSKGVQKRLAREAGLPIVNSRVIRTQNGEFRIPRSVTYPCFVKPNVSRNSSKSRMRRCDSRKELRATLKEFSAKKDIEMIVEDYLDIKRECSLLGVSTKDGVLGPGFFFAKDGGHNERRGVAMTGELVPYEDYKELLDSVNQFVSTLEYDGLFDVDLVETTDGKIYFVELNLRFGASGYAVAQSGVNLPGMYADYRLLEKPIDLNATLSENGKSFVSEKIMIDEYLNNYITKAELNQKMAEADVHFIKNDADPRPYKHFKRYLFIATVIRTGKDLKAAAIAAKKKARAIARKIKYVLLGYPQGKKENWRNPNSERPRVVVAGRNYSSNLCMARALGEAGYEVEILRIFTRKPGLRELMKRLRPDCFSKYVKSYRVCVTNGRNSRIVRRLKSMADKNRKMLLIPADDLVASAVDSSMKQLSAHYLMPNVRNREGKLNRLMRKSLQKSLAREAGIPVINSCRIRTKNRKFRIPESVTYPCFIKPNISKNGSKNQIRMCASEEELRRALRTFSKSKDVDMLVEDYVEIKKEYSLLGVSTKDGVLMPGFFSVTDGGHKERLGVAMTGEFMPCTEKPELLESLKNFVASLNYEGLFDIDLIETADGQMYFVELNLRFGASGYAVAQSGLNLPGMFADYMVMGKPIELDQTLTDETKRFVSEKIMIEEYTKCYITKEEMNQKMKDAEIHFVKNDEDPKPYQHFKKFYLVADLMRLYYQVKEKRRGNRK